MVDSDQSYDKLTFRYLLVSQILSNLIGRLVNQFSSPQTSFVTSVLHSTNPQLDSHRWELR